MSSFFMITGFQNKFDSKESDKNTLLKNILSLVILIWINGVLIYLAVSDKAFAICGDKGINDLVPTDFWVTTKEAMLFHFKNGNFKEGLVDGIQKAGSQLKSYFPWQKEDANELSNEISKGE